MFLKATKFYKPATSKLLTPIAFFFSSSSSNNGNIDNNTETKDSHLTNPQLRDKKLKEIQSTTIPSEIDTESAFDPSTLPTFIHKKNYNMEEHPEYAEKVAWALKQREILAEVKNKPFLSRRARLIYDRPLHDTDIS